MSDYDIAGAEHNSHSRLKLALIQLLYLPYAVHSRNVWLDDVVRN